MNSEPLSESTPRKANGSSPEISSSAATTPVSPLPRTARLSTQVVSRSVTLRVWRNSPEASAPEWDTRSISVNPGLPVRHAAVWIGISRRSKVPGFVRPNSLRLDRRRSLASSRSIVRGLMAPSRSSIEPEITCRRRTERSQSGSAAFSRTDHGRPIASQTSTRIALTEAVYRRLRPERRA